MVIYKTRYTYHDVHGHRLLLGLLTHDDITVAIQSHVLDVCSYELGVFDTSVKGLHKA